MDARKLREELCKQGIYVHESDPIFEPAASEAKQRKRTTATASTTVTDCTSR